MAKSSQNLLFVCSRNQWRSPTAEKVFSDSFATRSAGTSPNAKNPITAEYIQWANIIFVMEEKHKNRLIARFTRMLQYKPIHVLNIEDNYKFMDKELIALLKTKTQPYL